MKRDMELIRKLLFKLEEMLDEGTEYVPTASDFDVEDKVMRQHLRLLHEANLIKAEIIPDTEDYEVKHYLPQWITWQGHEFIAATRDESIWNKTQQTLKKVSGSATLAIVQEIATKLAMKAIESQL